MRFSIRKKFYKSNSPEQMVYYRGVNNMTQEELAEKSSVDLQLIKDIESGKVEFGFIGIDIGLKLARALNTSVEELCQEIKPKIFK